MSLITFQGPYSVCDIVAQAQIYNLALKMNFLIYNFLKRWYAGIYTDCTMQIWFAVRQGIDLLKKVPVYIK